MLHLNHLYVLWQLNPDKDWNYKLLSENPNITWEMIRAHPDKNWNYGRFSDNPNITIEIVLNNPQIKWDYHWLSRNPSITWDIVQNNPQIKWDYDFLLENPNITLEIVRANPQIPWDYKKLSWNPNITEEIVQLNPDIPWNCSKILLRQQLAFFESNEMLERYWVHQDKPFGYNQQKIGINNWMYYQIIKNPNIPLSDSEKHNHWIFESFSYNAHLLARTVLENPDKNWDYSNISSNLFQKNLLVRKKLVAEKYLCRWVKSYRREKQIKDVWKNEFGAVLDLLKLRRNDVLDRGAINKSPKLLI